ncbi:MAG: DHH family phosphoesterase [Mycoplasma sp.]
MIKNNKQDIVKSIYSTLISSKKVTIIIHDNPDNDAYSSASGLCLFLKKMNVDARVMDIDMIKSEIVKTFQKEWVAIADEEFISDSVGIILDTGNRKMITSEKYLKCKKLLRIDHHVFCEEICETEWIDIEYSSTSEMIGYFILFNNPDLMCKDIANSLYPGIISDSGNLTYNTTQASTYQLIAKFYDYKFDKALIQEKMILKKWDDLNTDRELTKYVQITEDKIAYLNLTPEIIEKFNIAEDDGKIYLLNNIIDFKIWFSVYWKPSKNSYKVSIRSHQYDVRKIASKFGGGGHVLASAFYISSISDINTIILYARETIANG